MKSQNHDPENSAPTNLATVPSTRSLGCYERARKGTSAIAEIGAKARGLDNLKVGSETIRTDELIDTIVLRLLGGESLLSISTDPDMPSRAALLQWQRNDEELRKLIQWARAEGMQFLYDARQDIVSGGYFSTGDKDRDFELARVIKDTAAVRNPAVFGNKVEVTKNTIHYTVNSKDANW